MTEEFQQNNDGKQEPLYTLTAFHFGSSHFAFILRGEEEIEYFDGGFIEKSTDKKK